MLEADGVYVDVRGRSILRGVSVTLEPGRFYAVIGPNGAGKSTLLKLMSGELAPTLGEILLDGAPLREFSPGALATRRAVVAQSAPLSFPFRVEDVVALGVTVPGFATATSDAAVARAMAAADLHDLRGRLYTQLSGGERQRVQIARALCQLFGSPVPPEQTLLLFDEPTSNLDLPHQLHLMRLARAEARAGRAVLAVLHDVNLAAAWVDTLIAVRNGAIVAIGPPHQVVTEAVLENLYGTKLRLAGLDGFAVPVVLPHDAASDASLAPVMRAS